MMPSTVSPPTPPRRLAAVNAPGKSTRRSKRREAPAAATPAPDRRAAEAQRLNLLAGIYLQAGHHSAAETLSWRAWSVREGAP